MCHNTCMVCHFGKMKCSYSTLHAVRRDEMLASGELTAAKGGRKVAPKKKLQYVEGSGVKVTGATAVGKRKRQSDDTTNDSSVEFVSQVIVPRISTISSSSTQPYVPDTDLSIHYTGDRSTTCKDDNSQYHCRQRYHHHSHHCDYPHCRYQCC